jgi:hypothetical protein
MYVATFKSPDPTERGKEMTLVAVATFGTRRLRTMGAVLLAIVVFAMIIGITATRLSAERRSARRDLASLASLINVGDSRVNAAWTITHNRSLYLDFDDSDKRIWRVRTPLEFGATNWHLMILFDSDDVAGIGIRTADSPKLCPDDAPRDRIRAGAESAWRFEFGPF